MGKRIILCVDGIWNTPHGTYELPQDANVRKIYLLAADDSSQLK
jgi:Uncharacterized alpha/beta hydrolase domain (DUF2235)